MTTGRLVTTTLEEPSLVYGMHGGEKLAQWKCLVRRNNLFGPWEAVEWSWLPRGGASGEHLHSRTEQLDYIVSGTGVMTIDGEEHTVTVGDVILTGLGTRHGLRNVDSEELAWLVTEVPGPMATSGLPVGHASIARLDEVGDIDAREVLAGPLRSARLIRLDPGQSEPLAAEAEEHVLYTLGGAGRAITNSATVSLRQGVSVSVPLGGRVTLETNREALECFAVSLVVPGGAQ